MNRFIKRTPPVSGHRLSIRKQAAIVALLGLAALSVDAASRNWLGGSATWDDTTTANWSGGAVPVNGDTAQITTPGVNVAYSAANLSGTGLNDFHLMNTGASTTTLTLDGTDYLPAKLVLSVGRWATGAATLNLTGNALVTLSGGGSGLILGGSGGAGPFVFNQSGGTFTNGISSGSLVYIYSNATYNLSDGSYVANRNLDLHGGTFNQSGGTVTLGDGYGMTIGANSTFTSSAGTFNQGGASILIGQDARVRWTGGTLNGLLGRLKLTGTGALWFMQGGTATVNRNGNTSAAKDSLFLVADSTVRGYGTIQDARFGASSPATLDNSGRVVADGCGADRDFNLSRFGQTTATSMIANTTDNTTSNGWFAISGGKLLLPAVAVPAGSSVTNWGEAVADTTIDLVNSARIAFTGATAGNLTGSLLAVDRADVPTGLYRPTAVWAFGGIACASATLTLRYDDAAAAALNVGESDLRVWRHNGAKWLEITGTQDIGSKTITSQATGSLAATSLFAVAGKAPAAGTLITIR